jgi:hypothetical protein
VKRIFENLRGKAATLERRIEHLRSRLAAREDRGAAYDRQEISALRAGVAALDAVEVARTVVNAWVDDDVSDDRFEELIAALAEKLDRSADE